MAEIGSRPMKGLIIFCMLAIAAAATGCDGDARAAQASIHDEHMSYVAELIRLKGLIDPDDIRRQTPEYVVRLKQLSDHTFGEWVKLFGDVRRRAPNPHR